MQGASLRGRGGFRRPLRSRKLTKKNGGLNKKMRMTESQSREVHGFRRKVATCERRELHGPRKQPGRLMYGLNRKDGEKEQCTGKPFANHTTPANIVVGRADHFDFFLRFDNIASCIYSRRQAGASQLRLLACVVAL